MERAPGNLIPKKPSDRHARPGWPVRLFPFIGWFRRYGPRELGQDAVAGITVALVLVPQSMAYAQLAGLPPYYGLYASLLPACVGALFGSSRQLSTGPVAMVSLMTAAALTPLAPVGGESYVAYAFLLALLVGSILFALGLLRLGIIVNLVAHPVIIGFSNAAARIIASSPLPTFFGVDAGRWDHHYDTVYYAVRAALSHTHGPTLAMGLLALGLMWGLKRLHPKTPTVLVAAVLATALSWIVGYERNDAIPLDRIESEEVREKFRKYNATLAAMNDAEEAGRDLEKRGRGAEKLHGRHSIQAIQLHYQRAELELTIREHREEASRYRTDLRDARFEAVEVPAGGRRFHLQGRLPAGLKGDGRTWRLRAGSSRLREDAVTMMSGGAVVGQVPRGVPRPVLPGKGVDLGRIWDLSLMALIIALVGFMESISIAKAIAGRTDQRIDPNQELVGQGLANLSGAFFQGCPVAGSFSRTAVNYHAGAITGLASAFTGAVVLLVLLFLTPLLYHMPQSVLAAIIVMAAIGLVSVRGFVKAWQVRRDDGVVAIVAFAATLVFAPHLEAGISIGVLLSIALLLFRQRRPRTAILSKFTDGSYRDAERRGLDRCRHILVIRFNGALFFANAIHFEDRLAEEVSHMPELKYILIVGNGINDIDVAGEEVISSLFRKLRFDGYEVSMSGVNDALLDIMKRSRLIDVIGEGSLYPGVDAAIRDIHAKVRAGVAKGDLCALDVCPLTTVKFVADACRPKGEGPAH